MCMYCVWDSVLCACEVCGLMDCVHVCACAGSILCLRFYFLSVFEILQRGKTSLAVLIFGYLL